MNILSSHLSKNLKKVVDHLCHRLHMPLVLLDSDLVIRDCNQQFLEALGVSEEISGRRLGDFLLHPAQLDRLHALKVIDTSSTLSFKRADSTPLVYSVHLIPIDNLYLMVGERFSMSESDIVRQISALNNELTDLTRELTKKSNDLERANRSINQLLKTDRLTGLFNRDHLWKSIALQIEDPKMRPLFLIMCDLDNFKAVNDTYGHSVGDEVLKGFSRIMEEEAPEHALAGRFGGEEFLLLIRRGSLNDAYLCGERIRNRLATTLFDGIERPVTASFGVAESLDNDTVDTFFQRADRAMYRAKGMGKNRVVAGDR